MLADVLDMLTRIGWLLVAGGGGFAVIVKAVRSVLRVSKNVEAIYKEFQPNHGESMHDRLSRIEAELGIDPPKKEKS